MVDTLPYCGAPPVPGGLLERFNTDPVLLVALLACATTHIVSCRRSGRSRAPEALGWTVAAVAFTSPLCALSVALFSARVAQHMLLLLVAAPLIARALPGTPHRHSAGLWAATALCAAALWFWHMPRPYDATFASVPTYWAMHLSLFGSGIWLWRELLDHPPQRVFEALAAGTITSLQMGLLGAILTLAGRPLFARHYFTTEAWGLSPLQDQQLGGLLMWVPGCLFFLWAATRSLRRLWAVLEEPRAAAGSA